MKDPKSALPAASPAAAAESKSLTAFAVSLPAASLGERKAELKTAEPPLSGEASALRTRPRTLADVMRMAKARKTAGQESKPSQLPAGGSDVPKPEALRSAVSSVLAEHSDHAPQPEDSKIATPASAVAAGYAPELDEIKPEAPSAPVGGLSYACQPEGSEIIAASISPAAAYAPEPPADDEAENKLEDKPAAPAVAAESVVAPAPSSYTLFSDDSGEVAEDKEIKPLREGKQHDKPTPAISEAEAASASAPSAERTSYLPEVEVDPIEASAAASAPVADLKPEPSMRDLQEDKREALVKKADVKEAKVAPASPLSAWDRILLSTQHLPPRSIVFGNFLGEGAFGQVFRGQWGERAVALKEIAVAHAQKGLKLDENQILESFEWEIARLSALSHPHLVDYYGLYHTEDDRYFMTLELCTGGSLRSALNKQQGDEPKSDARQPFSLARRWKIALQIAEGLAYLHAQGVLHRDLKTENILLDAASNAKLADLGVAQADVLVQESAAGAIEKGFSDPRFKAPEELYRGGRSSRNSSTASDLFSYGLVLWELFVGGTPDNLSRRQVLERLKENGEREPIPKECPRAIADLIRTCWRMDPKQRPTVLQVMEQLHACAIEMHTVTPSAAAVSDDAKSAVVARRAEAKADAQALVASTLAAQRSRGLLQEYHTSLAYYLPSFSLPYLLDEDPDSFWQRREEAALVAEKAKADVEKPQEKEAKEIKEAKIELADEKPQVAADRLQSVDSVLHTFLAAPDQRVLVLFGDAGFGKSLAAYQLADRLLATETSPVLPMLLRHGLPEWRYGALTDGLDHAAASPLYALSAAQQAVLKTRPTVWIIDGYDELGQDQAPQNLPTQLGLDRWPHAKLIISCRRNIVPISEQAPRFGLGERQSWNYHQLLPFNQDQLLSYMQRRLGWEEAERQAFTEVLQESGPLRALLRTPFVLQLLVQNWNAVQDIPLDHLSRFSVYQRSLLHFLTAQKGLIPEPVQRALQSADADWETSFYQMAEKLATYGHAQDQVSLPLDKALAQLDGREQYWLQLPRLVGHYAKHEFRVKQKQLKPEQKHRAILSQADYVRLRRNQAEQFLRQSPFKPHTQLGRHDYRHKSLYEYLMAHALVTALQQQDQCQLHDLLQHRLIQQEPAIAEFLREAYQAQDKEMQRRWEVALDRLVRTSAQSALPMSFSAEPYHWSANAATVLNHWGVALSHKAWQGVQLPGAVLSYGVLAYSDLQQANLRGATLIHTMLYQADLCEADLRDVRWGEFPWLTLKRGIDCIAHHPTRPWVAVGQGCDIVLLDTETGTEMSRFKGHVDSVMSVSFSLDGRRVVSGSYDKTVRLWDAESGQPISAPLAGHTGWVNSVSFSPDGRRVVSGSHDETVRLWDVESGQPISAPLVGHEGWVYSVSFSPDGRRVVSGSGGFNEDNTIRLWDAVSGQPIGTPLAGHTNWVRSVSFSPDGRRVASGSNDYTVRLWDAESGQVIGAPLRHEGWVTSVSFSPDGRRVVSGSEDATIRLWDAVSGQLIGAPLAGHKSSVLSVSFSPDGRRVVSGSRDATVRLWDTESGQPLGAPLAEHTGWVRSASFSPDDRRVCASGRLWDAVSGQPIGAPPLVGHREYVSSVSYSPDGCRVVFVANRNETIRLLDTESGQPIGAPLAGHTNDVLSVSFSSDGRRVASGSLDRTVRLWDAVSGQSIGAPLVGHKDYVSSVSFSPDGRRVVSGSRDKTVRLWDAESGQPLGAPLTGHKGSVLSVSFSPDGRRVVSGSDDDTVRLWDAESGQQIGASLAGHKGIVDSVSFSPDGRRVVSASRDKTVRLWDAESGRCLQTLQWHTAINSVALVRPQGASADALVMGDSNGSGQVSFWTVDAAGFRLINLPRNASLPMFPQGTCFAGCRLDRTGQRLLQQYGAEIDAADAEMEELPAPLEAKEVKAVGAARIDDDKLMSAAPSIAVISPALLLAVKSKQSAPIAAVASPLEMKGRARAIESAVSAAVPSAGVAATPEPLPAARQSASGSFVGSRMAFFEQIAQAQAAEQATKQTRPRREAKQAQAVKAAPDSMAPAVAAPIAASRLASASAPAAAVPQDLKLPSALTASGMGLFRPGAAAAPMAPVPEAQRPADLAWLDALEQQVDDGLDFRDPEQLRLSMQYTDRIDALRTHCQTAPLLEAQRQSLQDIVQACEARQVKAAMP